MAALINTHRRGIEAFLTGLMTPERMAGYVFNALRKTPDLARCSDHSLLCAMYESAVLQLAPNTYAQECFLIPRKIKGQWEVTFQVGYRGAVKLAMRAKTRLPLVRVRGENVFAMDAFERIEAPRQQIEHHPHNGPDKGEWLGTYGMAEFLERDGERMPEIHAWLDAGMMARIEAVALGLEIGGMDDVQVLNEVARFRQHKIENAGSDTWKLAKPWYTWPDMMRRKSAIKRVCKDLPLPDDVERALHLDDLASALKDQQQAYALHQILQDGPSPGHVQVPRTLPGQQESEPDPPTPEGQSIDEDVADLAQRLKERDPTKVAVVDRLLDGPDPESVLTELRKLERAMGGG